jgi:hypothetical protein
MTPVVVTYIGFVVAALILLWGVFVVGKRYFVPGRKTGRKKLDAWVPLKTTATESPEDSFDLDEDDRDEDSRADLPSRARQNGHYSGSKKIQ